MRRNCLSDCRWLALVLLGLGLGLPSSLCAAVNPPVVYHGIRIVDVRIPMSDGVKLAANLFMPADLKPGERLPVILEYLPYRKDDWTAEWDFEFHSYFVHRGYISARVDIRGTGSSQGHLPPREYSQVEQRDGMDVIAWLARQPWSSGSVGMIGISWGGFNSLQMAMREPPALKAIIAICATDQLFTQDIHYIDGLMHADEFELAMDLEAGISPSPGFPVDEKTLENRFDAPPWFLLYLKHQRDGEFWHEPVRPINSIYIPVFLVGGFLDGYRDTIPDYLKHLKAPVKALVGPWNHGDPDAPDFGPAIEWRAEAVRWWDRWLKGEKNGIMKEPKVRVYMRHWYAPGLNIKEIPGEWRSEESWPPKDQKTERYFFEPDHSLGKTAPHAATHLLKDVPTTGIDAGFWWGDLTTDQRGTDAYSLVYDSPPLDHPVAILGLPRAILKVSATAPLADWFARLSDVAPDGRVTLITGAGISGAQRRSLSDPENLVANRVDELELLLHFTSWVFPKGHRIRVAISNAIWPMIWPVPYSMTTSLYLGGGDSSGILLPVVPLGNGLPVPHFGKPTHETRPDITGGGDTWPGSYKVIRDEARQATRVEWGGDDGSAYPWGSMKSHEQLTYDLADANPAKNSVQGAANTAVNLPGRKLNWKVLLSLTSDANNFYYEFQRILVENGKVIRHRTWKAVVSRDHQ